MVVEHLVEPEKVPMQKFLWNVLKEMENSGIGFSFKNFNFSLLIELFFLNVLFY